MSKSNAHNGDTIERTRQKIRDANLVYRLLNFVKGEGPGADMTPMQVTTALALIKKTVPDVRQVEIKAEVQVISRSEVEGVLLEAGINPESAWKQLAN